MNRKLLECLVALEENFFGLVAISCDFCFQVLKVLETKFFGLYSGESG